MSCDIVIYLLRMYAGSMFRLLFRFVDASLLVLVAILTFLCVNRDYRYGNSATGSDTDAQVTTYIQVVLKHHKERKLTSTYIINVIN